MKSIRATASALALTAGLAMPYAAEASVINFNGVDADFGTVSAGQSGSVQNNLGTGAANTGTGATFTYGSGSSYGFLPSDSEITFTYNLQGMLAGGATGYGSYNYTFNNITYTGNAAASTVGGSGKPTASAGNAASAALVFASANLNPSNTLGTVRIINVSKGLAQFQSALSGVFGPGRTVAVNYQVSAVPLPASLPLFLTAMLGLIGFGAARKRGFI